MTMMQTPVFIVLLALLSVAVVSDLRHHRIPNILILIGIALGFVGQLYFYGGAGVFNFIVGVLLGFFVLLPMYALGGMAAGDVKLMAAVGGFLWPGGALWAAFCSLIAGGVCGVLIVAIRGQLLQTFSRYGLMLRVRTYFSPSESEVTGKPFPYSIAISLGTLVSLFWRPLGM